MKVLLSKNFNKLDSLIHTVNNKMNSHDPTTPEKIVSSCDDRKNCRQNCIAEKTKIDDSNEITNEREVWTARKCRTLLPCSRERKNFHFLTHFHSFLAEKTIFCNLLDVNISVTFQNGIKVLKGECW